jgi:hypothetical protein
MSWRQIAKEIDKPKSTVSDYLREFFRRKPEGVIKPKILLFDIETAPELYYGFGRYKQNIQEDFVVRSNYLLSFCAKWLGEDGIASYALPYYEERYKADPYDDSELASDLHALLSEADIVIAHNLAGFDWKVANTRFLVAGLDPISPTKLVDTLKIAKSQFKFPTNRLDTIARYLGVGQKLPHSGASLWRGCMEGDDLSWKQMVDYNTVDVEVLEEVYLKLRAFDKRHPNVAVFYPDAIRRCVCCGSHKVELTDKKAYTNVSEFDVYQCQECGKHMRDRVNTFDKEKRQSLMMNPL